MISETGLPLTIESMSGSTADDFLILSKSEIQHILRDLEKSGARVAMYFDEGNDLIPTTIIGVSDEDLWVDVGPKSRGDQRILNSREFVLVSSHHQVKVQFMAHRIKNTLYGNREAYCLPLPDRLLRVQHRDFYRVQAPSNKPLNCVIPAIPKMRIPKRELVITDMSEGGISVECDAHEGDWQPGKLFQNCQISLPDAGMLTVTLKVKNILNVTLENGQTSKRAGCEFMNMNGKQAILLQRYLARIQSQILSSNR